MLLIISKLNINASFFKITKFFFNCEKIFSFKTCPFDPKQEEYVDLQHKKGHF